MNAPHVLHGGLSAIHDIGVRLDVTCYCEERLARPGCIEAAA